MDKMLQRMRASIYFNIPNLMGYLRILLIPVFLVLYVRAAGQTGRSGYGAAFLVLALSFLTDFLDGKIARKFDMITDFGKALDPVADKLTQAALAVAILFRYPSMLYFLILFAVKELYMGVMGLYLIRKGKGINGARSYGKICTAVTDIGCFVLLLFTDLSYFTGYLMIAVMMLVMLISFVKYIRFHISVLKEDIRNSTRRG